MYYKEELEPYKKRGIQLLNLRNLTRQQKTISSIAAQTKLQLHSILDQVFPEYRGVFGNLYSKVSLQTLSAFPTSEDVLSVNESVLTDKIAELCTNRSEKWAKEKAQKLREFYDKKREEGKPFRVAIIACANKLLHWVYAILKSRNTFQNVV